MSGINHHIIGKTRISLWATILFLFSSVIFSYAQTKEGNNWYFGNRAGVRFVNNVPQGVSGGATTFPNNLEGTATISDTAGNLLFYSDGNRIWNRNHSVMETGLMGHYSSTQSAVIVPHPTARDTFYVFTIDASQNNLNNGLRYTVVDIKLNSGLGGVPSGMKNILLSPSGVRMAEKITAVRHCNNVDVWVIGHGYTVGTSTAGQNFYAYLITPSGINTTPVISAVGTIHRGADGWGYGNSRGYMKASTDGRRIALAITYDGCANVSSATSCARTTGAFEVFDFNYTTGQVTNPIKLTNNYKGAYGVEFSADGNILYGSTWAQYSSWANPEYNRIYQWNLNAGNQTAIQNSERIIADENPSSTGSFGALQLASDGKVYIVRYQRAYLSAINFPQKLGASCGYVQNAVGLTTGTYGCMGLPTFLQSYFNPSIGFSYYGQYEDMLTQFFIADSMRIDSVLWEFIDTCAGQPRTSRAFNPSYQYCDTGDYRVRLFIWKCNIVDTVEHTVVIHPRPSTGFTINDTIQCVKDNEFTFTNNTTIKKGFVEWYHWDFGDGDTSNLENPTHKYTKSGNYTVKLIATSDKGGMDSITKNVRVLYSPNANFLTLDTSMCFKNHFFLFGNISNIATSSSLSYIWDMGNGDTMHRINPPVYYYTTEDSFLVILTAISDSGCVDTSRRWVYTRPMPKAGFTVEDTALCLRDNVFKFTDTTLIKYGNLNYRWFFGNNDSLHTANPHYSYSSSGTYNITQIVSSEYKCRDTAYHSVVVHPMPAPSFSINDSTQCLRDNLFSFSNSSSISSGSLSYLWNFGDDTTSILTNTQHSYLDHDTFSVTLTAISNHGCRDSLSKNAYVFPMPAADFSINNNTQCLNENDFRFTNLSTIASGSLSYDWNFGDTSTSILNAPAHKFDTVDTFAVRMIVTSALGCRDTMIRQVQTLPYPDISFYFNDSVQCLQGNSFEFFNSSSILYGSLDSFYWNFGNSDTSTLKDPVYAYLSPGNYTVRHIVYSDLSCKDTLDRTITVHKMPLDIGENPSSSSLSNGLIAYYPFEGNANDHSGNGRHATVYGATQSTGIIGNAFRFNGSSHYIEKSYDAAFTPVNNSWTISAWINVPSDSYTSTMVIAGWYRCGVTTCGTNDQALYSLELNSNSQLVFKLRDDTSSTAISVSSSNTYDDGKWHFVTGVYSADKDSVYMYVDNCLVAKAYAPLGALNDGSNAVPFEIGREYVTSWGSPRNYFTGKIDELRIYNRSLNESEIQTLYKSGKTVDVEIQAPQVCKSDSTLIKLISPEHGVKYRLYNHTTSQAIGAAQHTYCDDTLFFSTGAVFDTSYFYITAQNMITLCEIILDTVLMITNYPQPSADFSISDSNQCYSVNKFDFTNSSGISSGSLTYLWHLGDGNTETSTNSTHTYANANTFSVKLIATSDYQCVDSISKNVIVRPSPVIGVNLDKITLCHGTVVQTYMSGADYYQWSPLSGIIYASSDSDTVYVSPDTTTLYTIVGFNNLGCSDTITSFVDVFPLPVVDAGQNDTICFGESIQLSGSGGLIYSWSPGASLNDSTIANPVAAPSLTTTYYLTATNPANELIYNGDFSLGNAGFNSAYIYNPSSLILEGRYWVGTNPNSVHSSFASCSDHTSGSGNMMVVNGSTTMDMVVWEQSVNITKNTYYAFSTWITSVVTNNPAQLSFSINGQQLGNLINPTSTTCQWQQFYVVWYSDTNTTASISIVNKNTVAAGNDFALDDISFAPLCSNIDSVTIVVNPTPVASFDINDSIQCFKGNLFLFNNATSIDSGTIANYWTFGDGSSSGLKDPSHSYHSSDTFLVKLRTVSDKNCVDSIQKTIYVFPNPLASFSISDSQQCFNGNEFTFTNNSIISKGTQSFLWNFGDGNTSITTSPVHSYLSSDSFAVKLIATSDLGCTDSMIKASYVFPSPFTAFAINDSIQCYNQNYFEFTNYSNIQKGSISQYWSFGDGNYSATLHPTHIYNLADTFTVKLINTSDLGCLDSIEKTTIVLPSSSAAFNITSDTAQCLNGNRFRFRNLTDRTEIWYFGDGDTSTADIPSHSYYSHDTFTVTFISTSPYGCYDTLSKTVIVHPSPLASFSINDSMQCLKDNEFIFSNTSQIDHGSLGYNWHFGDGNYSTQTSPQHIYHSDDTFSIKLIVTSNLGCQDSSSKTTYVYPNPVAYFSVNDSQQCFNGNLFTFSNNTNINTGTQSFMWYFGDNNTSSNQNPQHSYSSDDTFSVRMIATSDLGCLDSFIQRVYVFPSPQTNFSINDSIQCFNGHEFNFTNLSAINSGTQSFNWYFGDGHSSSTVHPTYYYSSDDTFSVKLVSLSDLNCADSLSKIVYVFPNPVASFSINDTAQCLRNNQFVFSNNTSINTGTSTYYWTFGDNNSSTQTTPNHSYLLDDTFSVKIIAASGLGCTDSSQQSVYVFPMPETYFSIDDSFQCYTANEFKFTNLSTIDWGSLSHVWYFGDGNTDSSFHSTHTYIYPDTFMVFLRSTSDLGCSDSSNRMLIVNPMPQLSFTINDSSQCLEGNVFSFSNQSMIASGSLSYSWDFDDGNMSSAINPTHTYINHDSFSVKLIATSSQNCTDSLSKILFVRPMPLSSFSINDSSQCLNGNNFVFTNTSQIPHGHLSFVWYFGDGDSALGLHTNHSYSTHGNYDVRLMVYSPENCVDSFIKRIYVRPKPDVDFMLHDNVQCLERNAFGFVNQATIAYGSMTYFWDFGDLTYSTATDPIQSYTSADTFTVKLLATSDYGCKDSVSKTTVVLVHPQPLAAFSINDTAQCLSGNLFSFGNQGTIKSGSFSSYWNYGDGNQGTDFNSDHSYNSHDTFNVRLLLISDQGCRDSITYSVYVWPMPQPDFTIDDSSQCLFGNQFLFEDKSSIVWGSLSSKWYFGNAVNDTALTVNLSYLNHDTFDVWLWSTSALGCTDSISKKAVVHPMPTASFNVNDTAQCVRDNLFAFSDLTQLAYGSLQWHWEFGDGNFSTLQNPDHSYLYDDTFNVKVLVESNAGCTDSFEAMTYTYPMPVADFSINDSMQCLNENNFVFSNGSNIPYGSLNFMWDFGDGNMSIAQHSFHNYLKEDSLYVKLLVTSDLGCIDSIIKQVVVHPSPQADFVINQSHQCLNGNNFSFTNNSIISSGSLGYSWDFGDGGNSVQDNPFHSYNSEDSLSVTLITTSAQGCKDTIGKEVFIFPNPQTDFSINRPQQCYNYNTFYFTNNSTINSGSMQFKWYHGDGTVSDSFNSTYSYHYDSSFQVKLVSISDLNCTDSIVKNILVYPSPVPDFEINDSMQCLADNSFIFTNTTSINTGSNTYHWSFGDVSTSTLMNPTHTYGYEDTFLIRLIVTSDNNCIDTVEKTVYVFPSPATSFTVDINDQCLIGNSFNFTNTSSISMGSMLHEWSFGDFSGSTQTHTQHSYTNADTFRVKLVSTSLIGCPDSVEHEIFVRPMPSVQFSIDDSSQCQRNNLYSFNNESNIAYGTLSHLWHFGNGVTSLTADPQYSYPVYGNYLVKLLSSSEYNCQDSFEATLSVHPMPQSDFSINKESQCLVNNNFEFTNQSSIAKGSIIGTWYFGDGNTSLIQNPSHIYSSDIDYDVKLVNISDKACKDSLIKRVYVRPMPAAIFSVDDSSQCLRGNVFNFRNMSTLKYGTKSSDWSFGDGSQSYSTDPGKTYATDGTYIVKLVITTDDYGCKDSTENAVIVHPMPRASFNYSIPCLGKDVDFTDNSTVKPPYQINQWYWDYRDGNSSNLQNPVYSYNTSGLFNVMLRVTTNEGCPDSVTRSLRVYPHADPPVIDRVTVTDDEGILIEWEPSTTGRPKTYVLERSLDYINYMNLASLNQTFTEMLDQNVDVHNKSYIYRMYVIDSCDNQSPHSNIGKSILLKAAIDDLYPDIVWTSYEDWDVGISDYELLFWNEKDKMQTSISTFSANDTSYTDMHTILNQSTLCYTIVATRNGDGQTSASNKACVPTKFNLHIPNAFTPNGDGLNDVFEVKGTYIIEYNLMIFDRWGMMLYESNDITEHWDGTFKGQLLPLGDYVYYIKARGTKGQRHNQTGTVLLLR